MKQMYYSLIKISKFLSFVLRHRPDSIGIELDDNGWADIDSLILAATTKKNITLNQSILYEVVQNNDKQRFLISEDKTKIRANQGHSVKVDLHLQSLEPPELLFHGTSRQFLEGIFANGLLKMNRHHVHLSTSVEIALEVGKRYGNPVTLEVNANAMYQAGIDFYLSRNNVWLVDNVPPKYLIVSHTVNK